MTFQCVNTKMFLLNKSGPNKEPCCILQALRMQVSWNKQGMPPLHHLRSYMFYIWYIIENGNPAFKREEQRVANNIIYTSTVHQNGIDTLQITNTSSTLILKGTGTTLILKGTGTARSHCQTSLLLNLINALCNHDPHSRSVNETILYLQTRLH